jgi:hypothetical protein
MRFLYRFFTHDKLSSQKVFELEKRISDLENVVKKNKEDLLRELTLHDTKKSTEAQPVIKIEHLTVDRIMIEKLDYANNFGQLGIKELSGKLNIGSSYEGDFSKLVEEKINEKMGSQTKINLRAKKHSESKSE